MYAFDQQDCAVDGHRRHEWTAAGATEEDVLWEAARCLRVIREGRVPS